MIYTKSLFRVKLIGNRNYFFMMLVILAVTGCVNGVLLTTPPDLQEAMDSVEKLRNEAVGRVKLVKNTRGKIKITDLKKIHDSYNLAQSLFSSWIDNVQNDLRNKKIGSEAVDYKKLSENAANQAKQFNSLVDGIFGIASRGDEIEMIKSFIKSGKELVDTIKAIEQAKRQELITKLESLRWKEFQHI